MRRFYCEPENIDIAAFTAVLTDDEARHLQTVLRLRTGDEVSVFDGLGHEWRGAVAHSAKKSGVTIALQEAITPAQPESSLHLTLGVALLKGEKFDWVVQKATELGVTAIAPLATQYADVRLRNAAEAASKVARWQRIALSAAKQSGRAVVPQVLSCQSLLEFLIASNLPAARLLLAERGGTNLAQWWSDETASAHSSVSVLVGPEGGWAETELDTARAAGWDCVTLGGRILRAETAALVAVTLLQHRLGDLR